MNGKGILKIKNRKAFLKELALSKKRNFENNMNFVKLRALWLKRTNNKEWSRRQKLIIDEVYKTNRHLKLSASD